ncbi:hypothetical protein L6259_02145 [Candidatus Parcubacteria bacterium]|nr:hypothetical protein [Candidatus Parcubacteria bacterium]
MPKQTIAWKCGLCKRGYFTEEGAQNCENKHAQFAKIHADITGLFNDFFPVIAVRSYFTYAYGTYSDEKIVLLGYDCNHFDFAKGTLSLSLRMLIRGKICKYMCEPEIEIEREEPLRAIREFVAGKKDKLRFKHSDRTHPNAYDLLALLPK